MKDPYAPESETTTLIKADTRTAAERELARLMTDAGDGEQGFEPEVALQRIALSLIAQLQDARTEVVALHATEQNLRDGFAPQDDHQAIIDSLPAQCEDKMFMQISHWARESYNKHKASKRGQALVPADAFESHVMWAALRWAKESTPPAQPAVPEGWKLVPETPTNEMTSAMADALEDPENERSSWDLAENMYRAMIAAAPKKDQP
jgi:hypothetical protein